MSSLQGDPEDVIELWTRNGSCQIELLSGDITQLSKDDMVDIIMVSAFTGDYSPLPSTVIGALRRNHDIDVDKLSRNKELDLRALFSCWLSKPIEESSSPFKKLLCFERRRGSQLSVPQQISEMFRVFVPVFNNQDHTVITPLLATGHQGYSKKVVCGTMVEAAIKWINAGLPLRKFKLVFYEGINDDMRTLFSALKIKYMKKNENMKKRIFKKTFDVFIMFNPKDDGYMETVRKYLQYGKEDIKLYANTGHFDKEKVWQDGIFKTMVACKRIVAILSPAFLESSECLEQYNMAMCCNRLLGADVLAPFYVDTIKSLPTYMGLVQWIDCRVRKDGETTTDKIQSACKTIIMSIRKYDYNDDQSAIENNNKQQNDKFEFDVFISYSHKNPSHAETLLESFKSIDRSCKVFYDRSSLTTGTNWQNMLYQSVGECRCFIALISSNYLSSTVCCEEFNLALARYMCKDKDMMLIPVCIEELSEIPSYVSTVQLTEAFNDYNDCTARLAKSVVEWLNLTAEKRPSIQEPIAIERILSKQRCDDVRKQYKVVENDNHIERIQPVVVSKDRSDEIDTTKVDIAVSYANDATHLAGSFCTMLDRKYPNLNMSVHTHGDQQRYDSLDTAKKIVIFISNDFLGNEQHMQELHLALSRQRPSMDNILYLVQVTSLSGRPFFPRILPYNIAFTDVVWAEFEKKCLENTSDSGSSKVSVFGKRRILEHASRFFCSRAEYFALTKAVDDVAESFVKVKDEKEKLVPMLINVKAIEGISPTKVTSEPITNGIDDQTKNEIIPETENTKNESISTTDKANKEQLSTNDKTRDEQVSTNDKTTEEKISTDDKANVEHVSTNDKTTDEHVSTNDKTMGEHVSTNNEANDDYLSTNDKNKDEHMSINDTIKEEPLPMNHKTKNDQLSANDKTKNNKHSADHNDKSTKGNSRSCILI